MTKRPCGCVKCSPPDPNEKHPPSIEGGRYVRSSPSQINTAQLCALKWHSDKKQHLPRKPPSKGQMIGEQGHTEIEHYGNTGEDVRGPIALTGAHLLKPYVSRLPFNDGDIELEKEIEGMVTPGGVQMIGYMDMAVPPQVDDGVPEIVDHKFRKNLEKYGATEDDLLSDPQAIVYGEWARRKYNAAKVRFTHHQHQHSGAKIPAIPVSVVLTAEQLIAGWAELAAFIDGPMTEWARESDPKKIPHVGDVNNGAACQAFGGCDYERTCPNSPRNRWANCLVDTDETITAATSKELDEKMGLLDQMDQQNTAAAPATPPPAAPAAPAAGLPPGFVFAKDGKAETLYKLPDGRVAKFAAATPTGAFLITQEGAPVQLAGDTVITVATVAAPPPATPPPAPAAPTLPAGAIFAKDAQQRQLYNVAGVPHIYLCQTSGKQSFLPAAGGQPALLDSTTPVFPITGAASATPPPAPSVLPVDAPVSNPAAPVATKAEADEEEDDNAALPPADAGKAKRGRKAKADTTEAPQLGAGLVLIVNGIGIGKNGEASKDLAPLVTEIAAKLAKASNVPDVRMGGNGPLGFGAWKGAMAEAAKQAAPSGVCHLFSSDLADPVIEALAPLATLVIRNA